MEYLHFIKEFLSFNGNKFFINNTDYLETRGEIYCLNYDYRSNYLFKITDWSKINSCILLNMNLRFDNPVINSKLRQEYIWNNLQIYSFGCNYNLTYKYINIGNSIKDFIKFIEGRTWLSNLIVKKKNI